MNEEKFDRLQINEDECLCDLVNNNKNLIADLKQKIKELENMIANECYCYCGKSFNKCKQDEEARED